MLGGLPVLADEPPPVQLGALVRGFAIPGQGRPDIQDVGTWRQRFDIDDVNEYASLAASRESVLLDGEVQQLSYTVRYGIAERWDVNAFVPLLFQNGGILDPIIQGWHHFWGLPNGGRELAPSNRFLYEYSRGGQVLVDVDRANTSLGDVQISSGYRLADHLAARMMLKLPTGSANRLSGNGAVGGAVWLDAGWPFEHALPWLTLYGSVGYSINGQGQVLPELQRHSLLFGSVGLRVDFSERWNARLQVYGDQAAYRYSELTPLTRVGAPLTLTANYRISPSTSASIGFQEKADVFASPDFGVHIGIAIDFR